MKQGITALAVAAMLLTGGGALNAPPLPPRSGPPPVHYDTRAHYDGRALPPPYVYAPDPAMPSYEVAAILRSRGFLPMSGPVRRGDYYIVTAMHENGERGRVVINAFSGRFIEFVPASQVAVAPGRDDMVLVYQGPTFPPPSVGRVAPPPAPVARGVPRPPAPIPRVASRPPSAAPLVTPKPRPQAAPQKPESAQAPPVPAPVETRPAAPSPTLVPKAIEMVLPPPVVQPTQPLPPVQTME
jgi:hypothetical protein